MAKEKEKASKVYFLYRIHLSTWLRRQTIFSVQYQLMYENKS